MKLLSKKATCRSTQGQDSSYFLGLQEYEKNPYDEVRNPTGIIQMGLAENQLSFDLLESWLANNPDAARFRRDGQSIFRELALFQDYHGLPAFKNALAEFMSEIQGNKVSFDPNKLVLTAGATSANETLMFCLAEPGDAFLLPTPYYPGFDRDLKWRTGVEIEPIQCYSANFFKITESSLDQAYEAAQNRGLRVKGILVTNPSNPLGTTLTLYELNLLITFVADKQIHLIGDEIYSGTVFAFPSFVSVLELINSNSEVRNRVHVVYGLSKDLGLPGFRVGAIYSHDDDVVSAATKMSSFGLVSSHTQHLLSAMLSDKSFTETYVSENRKRLGRRQETTVSGLRRAGIGCLESNSGLFCWMDMRHLLKSQSFEAEMELWKRIVYDVGLNVSPGSSCHCSEPGWFRLCFANVSEEALDLAMQRIKTFVDYVTVNNNGRHRIIKTLTKWIFKLSFDGRESDER